MPILSKFVDNFLNYPAKRQRQKYILGECNKCKTMTSSPARTTCMSVHIAGGQYSMEQF